MQDKTKHEQIVDFFDGKELTFHIERHGKDGQEWVAQCHQIPALVTGGTGYDEEIIQNQIKDAILTAAGVDGNYDDIVSRDISLAKQITATVSPVAVPLGS